MKPRFATLEEILPLRQAVIIAGTGRTSPYFDGNTDATTRHVGVFDRTQCVGCATWLASEWEGSPAAQLRGMATDPAYRGQGLGRAMLEFADVEVARALDVNVFWCNAREPAVGFYEKAGWRRVSELFMVDGVGPHYRMCKQLE